MYNREREQQILHILKQSNGFVTVKDLCQRLFASESSIRRDLKSLEERGMVKRSYGGASLVVNFSNIVTFNRRTRENAAAKREIAKKAAGLIKDGDILFLDQSSTAFYLANEIQHRSALTVVTNNIEIMMLLSNSAIKLISSGGCLSQENRNCLVGSDAESTFENIYADIAFFSVKAVSESGEVLDCSREEITVRNKMFRNARKVVLLCDSSKFGTHSSYKQCAITDVDYLISEGTQASYYENFKEEITLL